MYETHFELKRRPFNAAANARAFVAVASAAEALDALVHWCQRRAGASVLVGEAGTGKTLLCQVLSTRLRDLAGVVVVPGSHFPTRRALLQAVLHELQTAYEQLGEQELRLRLRDRAAEHLRQTGKPLALILDDAHRLNDACLDELRDWLDWSLDGEPVLLGVLAGLPALEEHLSEPRNAGLMQRIACHAVLGPLDAEAVATYVRERLRRAGATRELFTADALRDVAHISGGVPRAINALCDHALLLAYACEQPVVTGELIRAAYDDLRMLPLPLVPPLETVAVGETAAKETPAAEAVDLERSTVDRDEPIEPELTAEPEARAAGEEQMGSVGSDLAAQSAQVEGSSTDEELPAGAPVDDAGPAAGEAGGDRDVAEEGEWAVIEVGAGVAEHGPSSEEPAGRSAPTRGGASAELPGYRPGFDRPEAARGRTPASNRGEQPAANDASLDIVQPPADGNVRAPATTDAAPPDGGFARDFGAPGGAAIETPRTFERHEEGRGAGAETEVPGRVGGIAHYASRASEAEEPEPTDIEDGITAQVLDLCVETHQSIRKLAASDNGLLEAAPSDTSAPPVVPHAEIEGREDEEGPDEGFAEASEDALETGGLGESQQPQASQGEGRQTPGDDSLARAGREAMKAWGGICERLEATDSDAADRVADTGSGAADAEGDYDIVLPESKATPGRAGRVAEVAGGTTSPQSENLSADAAHTAGPDSSEQGAEHGIVLDIPAERRGNVAEAAETEEAAGRPSGAGSAHHGSHHADAVELARLTRRLAELFLHRRNESDPER